MGNTKIVNSLEVDSYLGLTYFVDWHRFDNGFVEKIFVDKVENRIVSNLNQVVDNLFRLDMNSKENIARVLYTISDYMYRFIPFYGEISPYRFYKLSDEVRDIKASEYFEYNRENDKLSEMLKTSKFACSGHTLLFLQENFDKGWRMYNVRNSGFFNKNDRYHVHAVSAMNFGDFYGIVDSSTSVKLLGKYDFESLFVVDKKAFEKRFIPSQFIFNE